VSLGGQEHPVKTANALAPSCEGSARHRGLKPLCSLRTEPKARQRETRLPPYAFDLPRELPMLEQSGACWSDQECAGMRLRIFSPISQEV
jgi:hypothetical protein